MMNSDKLKSKNLRASDNLVSCVLIVDDDHSLCKAYTRILEKNHYKVHLAHTLEDAKQLLSCRKFDTILADIFLGAEDGLTLLNDGLTHQADTPIVVMTAEPSLQTATHALRLKAYDYLQKPISSHQLTHTVARAVELNNLRIEKKQIEKENQYYQRNLEVMVAVKTANQKQAERQVREQNKFLTNILESLTYPFMVIDADDYSIKIANSAAHRSNTFHKWTCCHQLRNSKDHPCPYDGEACALKEVTKTKKAYHAERILSSEDGEQHNYEVHAFPLFDQTGHVSQVIKYYIDITEKKRLEAIAEAANLMDNLGYIFSGIRHEIGNPLNSVKMALSVLSKNLNNYDRKTMGEFINRSLSELLRVEYLLKALKNFSLFESPNLESVNINQFMHNFLGLVQDDFEKKGIQITSNISTKKHLIKIDHRALHQVLLNLMTNSADALSNVKQPNIHISIIRESEWIQIQVIDNGCGISKEDMQNIFKPFFTSKSHGTGLGLVIVKKMVSRMFGSITIESLKDKGTTVSIFFPIRSSG
jgi:signal transduction histidine kinase/DNA-binding response OmpR family regulator